MSLFNWAMRNAAGLLFAIALVAFFVNLIPFLLELGGWLSRRGGVVDAQAGPAWLTLLPLALATLVTPVLPLTGAAILYRLDRREQTRATFGATHD